MDNQAVARALIEQLALDIPPVALAFCDAAPLGVSTPGAAVPSACAFWRDAERGVFFAAVEAHANCPVGAYVMGFELTSALMHELQGLIGQMSACGYVNADETGKIPTSRRKARGILYGRLDQFPQAPDAVLAWLTPRQAMLWSEASGGAAWTTEMPSTVLGRPACAAIPAAIDRGMPTLSLGCMGMRTFTRIGDDRLLAVIPGAKLVAFTQAIARTAGVNQGMQSFYEGRLAALDG
jgi:uncharacterized protein (DUF169 family)